MPHLNFNKEKNGFWTCEADPALAYKDLMEYAQMSSDEQMEYVMEKHARIHFLKAAVRIVEEQASSPTEEVMIELARMNIGVMLKRLLHRAQDWEDEERINKVIALSECWYSEVDEHLANINLN